jgi:hypothetical protein
MIAKSAPMKPSHLPARCRQARSGTRPSNMQGYFATTRTREVSSSQGEAGLRGELLAATTATAGALKSKAGSERRP